MLPSVLTQCLFPGDGQKFAGFVNGHIGGVNSAGHTEKAVDHSFVFVDFPAADGFQQVAVFVAFVAERVVFGGDDQGFRQVGQLGGDFGRVVILAHIEQAEGAGQGVVGISGIRKVLVPVPGHSFPAQVVKAGAPGPVGRGVEVAVQAGIDQQLLVNVHIAGLSGFDGHGGGQVAAGAVAAYAKFAAAQQFVIVFRCPEGGGVAVVQRAGEPGFGRQAVIYRDDDIAGAFAEAAAGVVGRFQVADYPAAAVEPHQDGIGAGLGGRVDADGQGAAGAVDDAVFHIADFGDLPAGVEGALALAGVFARLLGGDGVSRRQAEGAGGVNNLPGLGVQGHMGPPCWG